MDRDFHKIKLLLFDCRLVKKSAPVEAVMVAGHGIFYRAYYDAASARMQGK
jgi:hypothetical protein